MTEYESDTAIPGSIPRSVKGQCDTSTEAMRRTNRLSMTQMDYLCQGLGHHCVLCNNQLPQSEDSPRVCPSVSIETCHEVARGLHTTDL